MKSIPFLLCISLNSCLSSAQDGNQQLQKIESALSASQVTISQVLSDEKYMKLHPLTAFREIIKKYANTEKTVMVTATEPGKRITVKGRVLSKKGEPIAGALVYVYQTSAKGLYADTAAHVGMNDGDMRHARLFAYFKTNGNGQFEFETVQPRGYPDADLPAHIHIMMWQQGQPIDHMPAELLFDDDERLTAERRKSALEAGFLIEKHSGTPDQPVYNYVLKPIGN